MSGPQYGGATCRKCGEEYMDNGVDEYVNDGNGVPRLYGFCPDSDLCPGCEGDGVCKWCGKGGSHTRYDELGPEPELSGVFCDGCWKEHLQDLLDAIPKHSQQ